MLDHAYARSRWADDGRIAFGKSMHEIESDRACFVLKSIVEERLPAACLLGWEGHIHTQPLQEMGLILERGGVELVTKTGDEKLGFWHYLSLI